MRAERRRAGRAIRKQRRDQAALMASIDWEQVSRDLSALGESMQAMARAALDAMQAMSEWVASALTMEFIDMAESYARKVERAETLVNQDS